MTDYVIFCDKDKSVGPFGSHEDAERYDAVVMSPCSRGGTHRIRPIVSPIPFYLDESRKYAKETITVWVNQEDGNIIGGQR